MPKAFTDSHRRLQIATPKTGLKMLPAFVFGLSGLSKIHSNNKIQDQQTFRDVCLMFIILIDRCLKKGVNDQTTSWSTELINDRSVCAGTMR